MSEQTYSEWVQERMKGLKGETMVSKEAKEKWAEALRANDNMTQGSWASRQETCALGVLADLAGVEPRRPLTKRKKLARWFSDTGFRFSTAWAAFKDPWTPDDY